MNKTIKMQLIELGMKESELDNHASDLYVLKNEISTSFIAGYEFKQNVKTFKDDIEGKMWYEIPFAYTEDYYKKFKVEFTGRLVGAIGITYKINDTIEAEKLEDVELKLYEKYEHISNLVINKA